MQTPILLFRYCLKYHSINDYLHRTIYLVNSISLVKFSFGFSQWFPSSLNPILFLEIIISPLLCHFLLRVVVFLPKHIIIIYPFSRRIESHQRHLGDFNGAKQPTYMSIILFTYIMLFIFIIGVLPYMISFLLFSLSLCYLPSQHHKSYCFALLKLAYHV